MSLTPSKDLSFKSFWSEPSDRNVLRFYSKANWDWLDNLQVDNYEKAKVAGIQTLSCVERELKDTYLKSVRSRIDEDGYYSSANGIPAPSIRYTNEISGIDKLRSAIKLLVSHGYPATFVLLLDECWDAVQCMTESMAAGTGNAICNMDILAWQVDPQKGSGFSPHRDRQPDDVTASFRSDGSPKYATCWLALSAAHCDNSCLYVIPKYLDPGYSASDFPPSAPIQLPDNSRGKSKSKKAIKSLHQEPIDSDPLRTALKDKESYQHIRALPLNPGEYVIFTHRIMHWGSKGRKSYHGEPRISLSVAFSDPTFEAPYFAESLTGHPSFEMRLALACAQMIIYYQRYFFCDGELLLFKKCFDCQAHIFNSEYRRKVLFEYSSAVMEIENAKVGGQSNRARSVSVLAHSSEGHAHLKERPRNSSSSSAVDKVEIQTEGKDDFEDNSDDFNGEDDDDDDDGSGEEEAVNGSQDEDEDESEEDEDGGFFGTEEGGRDDPLEHALDAMLDMEAEAHTAHKRAHSSASSASQLVDPMSGDAIE